MKNRKNILKGAGVLLIAVVMVFSSIAVANTNEIDLQTMSSKPQYKIKQSQSKEMGKLSGPIIWDNGGTIPNSNLYSSQLDQVYPFVSQVADDFHFEEDTLITDVHWFGGFWGGDPFDPVDFWIYIYADDGTGNAPTGTGMPDPSPTALMSYFYQGVTGMPLDPNGFYSYEVMLDPPFQALGSHKYWIAIQAVFAFPPQWGWANTDQYHLSTAVQGFPILGTLFWTVISPEVDMAWYLTGEEQCDPSIDVEKYVKDKDGRWQDADTANTSITLPKCTNATFKIVITNTGTCPLINIKVSDIMHDSLKFISATPQPAEYWYEEPFYYMDWYIPMMDQTEVIEIYITAHVEGPVCSTDYNYVKVDGTCIHGIPVFDYDYAYVHAGKGTPINMAFKNFLQKYANQFQITQKLLQLGL